MCPWFGGWGGWMGGPMMIMMVLLWGAIIYGAFVMFRRLAGCKSESIEPDRALAIARERFAKGEITKDEFEQIKKEL